MMGRLALLVLVLLPPHALAAQRAPQQSPPACEADGTRNAEPFAGRVARGDSLVLTTPSGWILRLAPVEEGWVVQVTTRDREAEDLSRLTPPWHFAANHRHLDGWHFRNADNTAPNDGSINAPGRLREFIFSPEVGRTIEYGGGRPTTEEVARARTYGRGWLFVESYTLSPPRRGERAVFESLEFRACLTWPRSTRDQRGSRYDAARVATRQAERRFALRLVRGGFAAREGDFLAAGLRVVVSVSRSAGALSAILKRRSAAPSGVRRSDSRA